MSSNTIEIIQFLSELALKSYRENARPDPYSATAAHIIATAAAVKICPKSADAATFAATIASCIDLSKYATQQAVLATQSHHAMKNYRIHEGRGGVEQKDVIMPDYNELVEKITNLSLDSDAAGIYNATFDANQSDKYRLALHAACAIYAHAYACSRGAYTHAVALAARYPSGEERNVAFKAAITKRLSTDLLSEPIEPSPFMKIICSDAMKVVSILLLVAGLAALSFGICAIAIAPVGIMLAGAIGLSGVAVTTAGSVATTTSGSLMLGRFFTVRKWKNDNAKSFEAVNAINNFESEVLAL